MNSLRAGALLAALAAATAAVPAQDRRLPGGGSPLAFGPRLLDYPMECVDPRGCRIECFQNGTAVASRLKIGIQDEVRLVISATASDDIAQRWIEIRPFNGNDVETLLLTEDTFCSLKALVVSPKRRP